MLLDFSHVESSERHGGGALSEQTNGRPLSQPLGQPGQVAVAVQVVGMQAAGDGQTDRQTDRQTSTHTQIERKISDRHTVWEREKKYVRP